MNLSVLQLPRACLVVAACMCESTHVNVIFQRTAEKIDQLLCWLTHSGCLSSCPNSFTKGHWWLVLTGGDLRPFFAQSNLKWSCPALVSNVKNIVFPEEDMSLRCFKSCTAFYNGGHHRAMLARGVVPHFVSMELGVEVWQRKMCFPSTDM